MLEMGIRCDGAEKGDSDINPKTSRNNHQQSLGCAIHVSLPAI
jgi:hypothetical protein